ncbi:MAG: hypothetical protein Q7J16_05530 [Candidatus Cloacimonadales bacterium]|nr:hypothetical protein [Candidatus Cloacimonadales bacterium]
MKKIIFILILILCVSVIFGQEEISKKQNKKNIEYLEQIDANINGTLRLLTAFNESANKMPDLITGLDIFSQFLMELTLECSNLKKNIAESQDLKPMNREILIQMLISTLNPDMKFVPFYIDKDKDAQNREMMKVMHAGIVDKVVDLQKKILQEEQGIIESETFNKYFFNLHSQHFIYQLLLDFVEPSEKLSKDNRNYLLKMIDELDAMMQEEKSDKENSK